MSRKVSMHGAQDVRRTRRLAVTGPRIARGLRFVLAFALVAAGLAGNAASAQTTLGPELRDATALRVPDDRWRARGMAFLDLPFGLRARYEAQALDRLTPRYELTPSLSDLSAGAARRSTRLIESRFALSRTVAPHLELELAWAARSPLSMVDLLRIEDQRVAAMIRFVP